MKRHAMLLSIAFLAPQYPVASTCWAGEEIAWGEPANGLRIGISCARLVISSIERPEFTVHIQNVADRRLTVRWRPSSSGKYVKKFWYYATFAF